MKDRLMAAIFICAVLAAPGAFASGSDVYQRHCAQCHHAERYGLTAPPLIPEYLGRRKEKEIVDIITNGLKATNMPGFKGTLTEAEIKEAAAFILSPAKKPVWGIKEISSTWQRGHEPSIRGSVYDLRNLFMIVEGGAGMVHFMDGDDFTLLDSIKAGAVHGGPKFDKNLRYAYIVTRDGWVIKYDLINLNESGRIRTAISARNIAISSDSRLLAVADLLPDNLAILDAQTMKPAKIISSDGPLGAVYSLRGKGLFVVASRDASEILLIDDRTLEVRKIRIDQPFTDFFIGPEERYLIGTSREGTHISIVDLESGSVVKTIRTEAGMPHLASAAVWADGQAAFAAFPHIGKPFITVMELYRWEIVKTIRTKGPGFFARTHEFIPELWADTGTDTIELIDKKTLEVTRELVPEKDKKAMHVEFTKDGSMALVSVWEDDGAVKVYDSRTLKPVKTMPFRKPVGKYNATNKKY